jgi:hypothetical protein
MRPVMRAGARKRLSAASAQLIEPAMEGMCAVEVRRQGVECDYRLMTAGDCVGQKSNARHSRVPWPYSADKNCETGP